MITMLTKVFFTFSGYSKNFYREGAEYCEGMLFFFDHTANEGPVRIQYKCLVPIYVFPEMKLCSLLISNTEL
jgi:hypothetical protein